MLKLKYNLEFHDLYEIKGLQKLDSYFQKFLEEKDRVLYIQLMELRDGLEIELKLVSEFLIKAAKYLEDFILELFDIKEEYKAIAAQDQKTNQLFEFKKRYIQRGIAKEKNLYDIDEINNNIDEIILDLSSKKLYPIDEWQIAQLNWFDESLKKYILWAIFHPYGQEKHANSVLFKLQLPRNTNNLLDIARSENGAIYSRKNRNKLRSDFSYSGNNTREHSLNTLNNCIICHPQQKDSCSKGILNNANLKGCPLDQKISEMHMLKRNDYTLGAMAVAMIDNPMIAATGHRICNDCVRACIYQKQDPIDIPSIESMIFSDIIKLPWGFEIYSLLTKWNPLKFHQYLPNYDSNYKVLVVGLGPAGFAMCYQLLHSGHTVVAIDGLKIRPTNHIKFEPIKNIESLFEDLSHRNAGGFGGVMEYGITVRWNKNYLSILRLLLERHDKFRLYGGVMFGGNITLERAWKLGFDHIVFATGAGKPILPKISNIMANGVRTASDFLMSLQLNGAGQYESLANLQIKLPLLIIGGGLTAVDAATESLVYYQVQIEKYLRYYELYGNKILNNLSNYDLKLAKLYLEQAQSLRKSITQQDKLNLLSSWGGVHIVYRRSIQESPSYRLNHEELQHALDEGIGFYENMMPLSVQTDQQGHVTGLLCYNNDHEVTIAAANILIAIGTEISNDHIVKSLKGSEDNIIMDYTEDGRSMSAIGDINNNFAGNVVKALASAKYGIKVINRNLLTRKPFNDENLFAKLDYGLKAIVKKVSTIAENIIEIIVQAQFAVEEFRAGQFYRLESLDAQNEFEPIALTGACPDKERGEISLIMLIVGHSTYQASLLKPGSQVVLMGPTGSPTLSFTPYNKKLASYKKILCIGGGLGNAVLLSIGAEFKAKGVEVIYIAGYKSLKHRWKPELIEAVSNVVIWCSEQELITPSREQDLAIHGTVVDAMNKHSTSVIQDIDLIITIGSDRMMASVAYRAQEIFDKSLPIVASINSPMQCMMKEICGQCIQRQQDPITNEEWYIFSCTHQDQNGRLVDFKNLANRLEQNCIQEQATRLCCITVKSD